MEIEFGNPESETKTTAKVVADIVCPVCFGGLPHAQIVTQKADEHGNEIRTYFGWCFECNRGYAVIQFARGNRWLIHKYMQYALSEVSASAGEMIINHCKPEQDWVVLNDLPRPAPVVLGPGGDFTKQITPELKSFKENIKAMQNSLSKLLKSINGMLDGND
jgi:hypothetical protein